jgi:hypothetical protein
MALSTMPPLRPQSIFTRWAWLLLGLVLGLTNTAPLATAGESPSRKIGYGLAMGYGYGVAPRAKQRGRDVQDVRTLAIEPYLHVPLRTFGDPTNWYRGQLLGLLQASILVELAPKSGTAGGGVLGLRYLFGEEAPLRTYVEGGLGVGDLGFDLESQDNGVSFFIHTALGVRYAISPRLSLIGSVLWQHVSNANSHPPNLGIDTVGFRLGIEIP